MTTQQQTDNRQAGFVAPVNRQWDRSNTAEYATMAL